MLTPTDIHYLIGLLTFATDGNDVEIELGDMVFDDAAEKERDVDITVTKKNSNGTLDMYRGIEVKDHSKPLDVIHVEQLCAKMADMPDLTHKAIVSASGYTKPAILKAQKHEVDLLEIVPWDDTTVGFEPIRTAKENWNFIDYKLNIIEGNVRFIVEEPENEPKFTKTIQTINPLVCYQAGEPIPNISYMSELANRISINAVNQMLLTEDGKKIPIGIIGEVNITANLADRPHAIIDGEMIAFSHAQITGKIQKTENKRSGEFKMLKKVGENTPLCCCVIYETQDGHLAGLSMSNIDEMSRVLLIPYKNRIKKKIFKEKFY
jgi:hypothetical protein